MRGHLLHVRDISSPNDDQTIMLPEGRIKGIYFVAELECATGVDLTSSIQIFLNGLTIMDTNLLSLEEIDNAFWGKPTVTVSAGTGTGGDDVVTLRLILPFEFESPNAITIGKGDNSFIKWVSGNAERGTLRIYTIPTKYQYENFIPIFQTLQITGDGIQRINIPVANTKYLVCIPRDTGDAFEVYVDGIQVENVQDISDLIDFAEMTLNIESGDLTRAIVDLAPSESKIEVFNDNVVVKFIHGANGTSTVQAISYLFNKTRIDKSADEISQDVTNETATKIRKDPERITMIPTPTPYKPDPDPFKLMPDRKDAGYEARAIAWGKANRTNPTMYRGK